jgi:hypothetical protein
MGRIKPWGRRRPPIRDHVHPIKLADRKIIIRSTTECNSARMRTIGDLWKAAVMAGHGIIIVICFVASSTSSTVRRGSEEIVP